MYVYAYMYAFMCVTICRQERRMVIGCMPLCKTLSLRALCYAKVMLTGEMWDENEGCNTT